MKQNKPTGRREVPVAEAPSGMAPCCGSQACSQGPQHTSPRQCLLRRRLHTTHAICVVPPLSVFCRVSTAPPRNLRGVGHDRSLACGNALWGELQSERSRDAPATEDSSPCTDMPQVRRDGVPHSEASNCPPAKSSRAVSLARSCATSTRAERSFRLRMARSACSPCTPAAICMSKDRSHRAQRHTDTTQRACDHANTHLNLGK